MAAEFIGGRIPIRFVAQGKSVKALVRPHSSHPELANPNIQIAQGSITALAKGIGLKCPSFSFCMSLAFCPAVGMETGERFLNRQNRPLLTRLAVSELGQSQRDGFALANRNLGHGPSDGFESAMRNTSEWIRTST